jgi:uncharacterized protein (TIGR03435 family)
VIPQVAASASLIQLLPLFLAVVWLCGFLVVIFHWYFRWRRISAAIRTAVPLQEGREVQALRRLDRMGGMGTTTEILLSRTSLEPGVFGITRPVLLWPDGISERLEDAHLEAILAHELWHVRRRDNLAATIHMVVEAIFWFHPLVWWLGARLLEERERACDEEVLESGSDRQVYAESILKICEFCVGSPLACVSGVTGADLKKRMAYIMTKNLSRKLDFSRKLLLSVAGLLAVAAPVAFGLLQATQTRAQALAQNPAGAQFAYEFVSVKPNTYSNRMLSFEFFLERFTTAGATLRGLIREAYGAEDGQISGAPDWINSERYDIEAKADKSVANELLKLSFDQRVLEYRGMLQGLLADRFKLSLHRETKELRVYALVIAKSGPKIQEAKPGDAYPDGMKDLDGQGHGDIMQFGRGLLRGQGVAIAFLVRELSQKLDGRIVVDKTGLPGKYDFTLQWTPADEQSAMFAAVQEQLGLQLEPQEIPVEVLVIDHVEKPSEPQAQSTAPMVPAFETASVKPSKSENPSFRIEPQAQNTAATEPGYEVASIKLHKSGDELFKMMFEKNGFSAINVTFRNLIRAAYGIEEGRIFGAPNWFNSEKYDVDARMENFVANRLGEMSEDQLNVERRRMLQALLADRFKLTLHRQTTKLGVYVLVVAKNGPKLQEAKPGDTYPNGLKDPEGGSPEGMCRLGRFHGGRGELVGQGLSMVKLLRLLSENILNRSVIDNTGLTGNYDFTLEWKIGDESQGPMFKETGDHGQVTGSTPLPEFSGPSFFNAIQEQLGLKLESQTGPVGILVIDHVEKPLGN